jgi:transcriptional antiterminator NusG
MSEELGYTSEINELENDGIETSGKDSSDEIETLNENDGTKTPQDAEMTENKEIPDDAEASEEGNSDDAEASGESGEAETSKDGEASDGATHSRLFEEEGAGQSPKWYVIHTYSGYENMVEQNLKKMVETNSIQDMITDIAIPVEDDIVEKANGKKKVVERKKFPGYVFVKLIHTKQIWYLVTSTRGVTSFVGAAGRAIALTPEEVKRMGLEKVATAEETAKFNVGDNVVVVSGALEKFIGVINSISHDKKKARVTISMFGRETSVDLEFTQIEKL